MAGSIGGVFGGIFDTISGLLGGNGSGGGLGGLISGLFSGGSGSSSSGGILGSVLGGGGGLGSILGGGGGILGGGGGLGGLLGTGGLGGLFSSSGAIGGLFASGGFFGAGGAISTAFSSLSAAILPALGPLGIAVGAFALLSSLFGGGRSPEEILQDEQESITGDSFREIGIRQAGITISAGTDGDNGAGGFITGANRDAFAEFAEQNGFDVFANELGVRVLREGGTQEEFNELIEAFRTLNIEAGNFQLTSEALFDLIETGAVTSSATVEENFARAFNVSEAEADLAFRQIDVLFDQFVADGANSTDAVSSAIAEHFGISVDAANAFVNEAGISANQWAQLFSDASGLAIDSVRFFGDQGSQVLSEISGNAEDSAVQLADSFRTNIEGLSGILNTIDLGTATGGISLPNPAQAVAQVAPPQLNVGTPFVRQSGLAIIDQGEAVLTREQNAARLSGNNSASNDQLIATMETLINEVRTNTRRAS